MQIPKVDIPLGYSDVDNLKRINFQILNFHMLKIAKADLLEKMPVAGVLHSYLFYRISFLSFYKKKTNPYPS